MATLESLAEAVRNAITSGSATPSTVTTLHTLLGGVPNSGSQLETTSRSAPKITTTSRTTKTTKPVKPAAKAVRKDNAFQIHDDNSRALSPKARYALATEVINIGLKVLSEATTNISKSRRREPSVIRSDDAATPRRHSRTSSLSQRALQIRSGNVTPVRQSPVKPSVLSRTSSRSSIGSLPPTTVHVTAVAECVRLGFSALGLMDAQKIGVKPLPKLQLETGMLSLAGMLIALRLDALAIKELRAVKRMLESSQNTTVKKRSAGMNTPVHENLASLLSLDLDFEAHPEAIPVAITYQLHLLRMITNSKKPATIEDASQHLMLETRGSPGSLILLSARTVGNEARAVRQLEALAQSLLQLCPSVSKSADEAAADPSRSPSPLTVFQLQISALRLRQQAWNITKRMVDLQKEVAEPFAKCMTTLIRRVESPKQAVSIHKACSAAHEALGLAADDAQSPCSMTLSRTFAVLADGAALPDLAYAWAENAVKNGRSLDSTHARFLAALALRLSLFMRAPRSSYDLGDVASDICHITQCLHDRPAGSKSDYDQLLAEIARLSGAKTDLIGNPDIHEAWKKLVQSAAGFASRTTGLFPGNGSRTAMMIVHAALLNSKSSDELISWVSKDTASLFQHAGALHAIAKSAMTMPMTQAWDSTSETLAFARTLRAIVAKAVTIESGKYTSMIFDDDDLEPDESGALLEWQLTCVLEMAYKMRHQKALQCIVPYILKRLLTLYSVDLHPVRRCRIAALAMRVREQFPGLLDPHVLQPFLEVPLIDIDTLGKDSGLRCYASDINASFGISLAFHNGPVAVSQLSSDLQTWQHLLETCHEGSESLANVVDNPANLLSQLGSLEAYAGVMGDDIKRLQIARMLLRASELCDVRPGDRCCYGLRVSAAYLSLGWAESADVALAKALQVAEKDACSGIPALAYYLGKAEQLLALDKVEDCQSMLDKAREIRQDVEPLKVKSHQSKEYKLLHGRSWLLQSRCFLAAGVPHDSLRAAKRSARVFNSIWSGIERATDQKSQTDISEIEREPEESSMEDLSKKVSKLNLKPATRDSKTSACAEVRGAAFWPVARLLCQALMHLADVYAHHGVFNEANYSSEQAMRIAESIQSQLLLSRVRSHRSILLAAGGRVEDAELCLAQDICDASNSTSLERIERLRAKCALSVKTYELETAFNYLNEAVTMTQALQVAEYGTEMGSLATTKGTGSATNLDKKASTKRASRSANAKTVPRTRVVPKAARAVVFPKSGKRLSHLAGSHGSQAHGTGVCYMLRKLEAQLIVQSAIISLKLDHPNGATLPGMEDALAYLPASFARCQVEHESAMRKVTSILGADFALNVLPESTVSFPAITEAKLADDSPVSGPKPGPKGKRLVKTTKRKASPQGSLEYLLLTAQQCLILDGSAARLFSTSETHRQYSLLTNTAMLLSATTSGTESSALHQICKTLAVEVPRMHAARCQLVIAELEKETFQASDLLAWPTSKAGNFGSEIITDQFQEQYVDILPGPWTAVSIGLDQDGDELYITRYRRGQTPLVLRLPFSRQKSEDTDDDIFDYRVGSEELKEIVELSNYSCHNVDSGTKGAKSNWWSEREALDLRLHELLVNIENVWLGGFRGALSQQPIDSDQLIRFRKDFETVLDRHLPSRRAVKRGTKKLLLADQVLELFIGLGSDQDGEVDLDEPLSDLLYFVVDMLQFNGERNAYDEVDFDSMAIEVLDALRSYHDSVDVEGQEGAHLILVLDRRLQAFPWESLPCLQSSSVSRVDSMLCLRDRIVEMRRRCGDESDRYFVTRQSGTYILNPSADLKNTEATIMPELSKLAQAEGAEWKAIVQRAPTEEEFSNALATSSTLLYFGHGAGSQYIRPRAIRRLEACSEVVWLMGCSSGAVTEHDELEPFAVPLAYLVAGQGADAGDEGNARCMAVVANLWDVTDKDIDRFSLAVGEEWGLWGSQEHSCKAPVKTPRKRQAVAAPLTPQRGAKTPKTPKVRKTPAPTRTPARSRSRARDVAKEQSLAEAVAKSRDACYLRYLNGAAPVVYGVPVYLGP